MTRPCMRIVTALCMVAVAAPAVAQSGGTVSGTIVDAESRRPLAGALVSVGVGGLGALTNDVGRYQIPNVPAGEQTIRAELIGYGGSELVVAVSSGADATADFELPPSAVEISGVVVTALGIERSRPEVTTSVQTLSGDDLGRIPEPNLISSLSGKVSGVHIINSNTPGGSARMVIRGVSSLTGNNQPLFVVDGIPVNNAASTSGTRGYNAIDYGNAISDINPQDIASISVLKGPNASALYGSRAANGAVIITTRRGGRIPGFDMTARADLTFDTPLKLPSYQNRYGQGSRGLYSATTDESWGPRLDTGEMIPQVIYGDEPAPWVSHPNNVRDFFEVGRSANTSVSMSTSNETANVRFSVSDLNGDGMLPGFKQERTTVNVAAGASLTDRLRAEGSMQYVDSDARNRPAQGYGEDNAIGSSSGSAARWIQRSCATACTTRTAASSTGTRAGTTTRTGRPRLTRTGTAGTDSWGAARLRLA